MPGRWHGGRGGDHGRWSRPRSAVSAEDHPDRPAGRRAERGFGTAAEPPWPPPGSGGPSTGSRSTCRRNPSEGGLPLHLSIVGRGPERVGGACDPAALEHLALFGELGLDGRGPCRCAGCCRRWAPASRRFTRVVVPASQLREAELVEGISARGVNDLADLFDVLRGGPGCVTPPPPAEPVEPAPPKDLRDSPPA